MSAINPPRGHLAHASSCARRGKSLRLSFFLRGGARLPRSPPPRPAPSDLSAPSPPLPSRRGTFRYVRREARGSLYLPSHGDLKKFPLPFARPIVPRPGRFPRAARGARDLIAGQLLLSMLSCFHRFHRSTIGRGGGEPPGRYRCLSARVSRFGRNAGEWRGCKGQGGGGVVVKRRRSGFTWLAIVVGVRIRDDTDTRIRYGIYGYIGARRQHGSVGYLRLNLLIEPRRCAGRSGFYATPEEPSPRAPRLHRIVSAGGS